MSDYRTDRPALVRAAQRQYIATASNHGHWGSASDASHLAPGEVLRLAGASIDAPSEDASVTTHPAPISPLEVA